MSGLSCSFLAIFSSKYCLGVVGASAMAVSRLVGATEWSFIQRRRSLAAPSRGVNAPAASPAFHPSIFRRGPARRARIDTLGALAEALRLLDQRGHFEHEQRGREDALFHHAMMGSRLLQLGPSRLEREHLQAADSASAIRVPVHA